MIRFNNITSGSFYINAEYTLTTGATKEEINIIGNWNIRNASGGVRYNGNISAGIATTAITTRITDIAIGTVSGISNTGHNINLQVHKIH